MDIGIERASTIKRASLGKTGKRLLTFFFIILIICFLLILRVQMKYRDKIVTGDSLTPPNIGLVFGAGLKAKGQPGAVLEDRIITAIKLFQDGKVGKIIMSGDNRDVNHNEAQAMKNFALEQGLPEDAIILDHAGLNTYDSCYRVRKVFGLNKIVLITQKYHLTRALYICNELGIDALGVPAEDRGYSKQSKYSFREYLASLQAWFEVNITKPKPDIN